MRLVVPAGGALAAVVFPLATRALPATLPLLLLVRVGVTVPPTLVPDPCPWGGGPYGAPSSSGHLGPFGLPAAPSPAAAGSYSPSGGVATTPCGPVPTCVVTSSHARRLECSHHAVSGRYGGNLEANKCQIFRNMLELFLF